MNVEIKRLSPELSEDYLRFFDITPHSTGKAEHRCYCVCWAGADCDGQDFSTAEKRRMTANEYVRKGAIQGYLAYVGGSVAGWCNANTKSDCYECISLRRFMQRIKKDKQDTRTKSILCFAVAPEMRRRGIAARLLRRVCEDAQTDGFDFVEAYPNSECIHAEDDFMGFAEMYEKAGFVLAYEAGDKRVMRKVLRGS